MSSFSSQEQRDLTPTSTPLLKNPMHSTDATVRYMRDLTLITISQIAWYREWCSQTQFKEKVLFGRKFNILQSSDDTVVKYVMQHMAGAFDAMNRRYLKSLTINIKDETEKCLLESYTMTYSYDREKSPMSLDISPSDGASSVSSSGEILTPGSRLFQTTFDLLLRFEETNKLIGPSPQRSLMDFRLSYFPNIPKDYIPTGFRHLTAEELRQADFFQEKHVKLRQGRIQSAFGTMGVSTKYTESLLRHDFES